jgi:hypothetical protein
MLVHWGFVILSQIGFVHVEVSMPVVDVCGGTAVMSECLERIAMLSIHLWSSIQLNSLYVACLAAEESLHL